MIIITKNISWHEVNSYDCVKRCQGMHHYTTEDVSKQLHILAYVYKNQVYYVICENDKKYPWIPYNINNGTLYFNPENSSYLSATLGSTLGKKQLISIPNSETKYPDYSNVDVGKGKKWPNEAFSPYVDTTAWPPLKFADIYSTTKVPFYNLGFIVSQSPTVCYPTWGTYYPAEAGPLNDQIKAIRELGGDVTVSFGGSANVPIHVTAPDVEILKEQYKRFILAYGLTRIDFDLGGIWIDEAYKNANLRNSQALRLLQDEFAVIGKKIDIWFTLPILPTGLTDDGLRILQLAVAAGINIAGVNAMTMDYGDAVAPNPSGKMGQYGIKAITSLKEQLNVLYMGTKSEAQLWAMIGTTPMIGVNDVTTESFKQRDANETLIFAKGKSIGMISMWSLNRDNTIQSHIEQNEYEFCSIFNQYN